jgi:hypothetical protein
LVQPPAGLGRLAWRKSFFGAIKKTSNFRII